MTSPLALPKPSLYGLRGAGREAHLETPKIQAEGKEADPGLGEGLHDALPGAIAPRAGRSPDHDHPPSPRAADLRGAPGPLREGDDPLDLRGRDPRSECLPGAPLLLEEPADTLVFPRKEGRTHPRSRLGDRSEGLTDLPRPLDLRPEDLPVVESREPGSTGVGEEQALLDSPGVDRKALHPGLPLQEADRARTPMESRQVVLEPRRNPERP